MSQESRSYLVTSYILRAVTIAAGAYLLFRGQWFTGFWALVSAALMNVPALLRRYRLYMPLSLEAGMALFVFIALFLGESVDLYNSFSPFDTIVHFQSGLIFAVTAFVLVYILNERERVKAKLAPGFVALFAATFAISAGALWEIGEFASDSFRFTVGSQAGLGDTMWDLIADTTGALIVAIVGYVWMRYQARVPFTPAQLPEEG